MAANGLQCDRWVAKTFFAHETQFVMYCLKVINDSTLILAHLSTPGQWVTPMKWHSVSRSCMPVNPITLGDSDGDTALKNFSPFH